MSGGGIFLHCHLCYFFFFKQKTAYELRISDWSSDVCSSDLTDSLCQGTRHRFGPCRSRHERRQHRRTSRAGTYGRYGIELRGRAQSPISHLARHQESLRRNGRARKSVVKGKSVSVRVDMGGRRVIKKKTETDKVRRIINR